MQQGTLSDFHARRLIEGIRGKRAPGVLGTEDLAQVLRVTDELPFFGLVERFDDSLQLLKAHLGSLCPGFDLTYTVMNRAKERASTLSERVVRLLEELGPEVGPKLLAANHNDLALYASLQGTFQERVDAWRAGAQPG
jgi:hypothetical protein